VVVRDLVDGLRQTLAGAPAGSVSGRADSPHAGNGNGGGVHVHVPATPRTPRSPLPSSVLPLAPATADADGACEFDLVAHSYGTAGAWLAGLASWPPRLARWQAAACRCC
jgi:hypothetical protein